MESEIESASVDSVDDMVESKLEIVIENLKVFPSVTEPRQTIELVDLHSDNSAVECETLAMTLFE